MTTCKHCGAEIPENTDICPNCGQQNTDNTVSEEKPEEGLGAYNIFDDFSDDEIDQMLSKQMPLSSSAQSSAALETEAEENKTEETKAEEEAEEEFVLPEESPSLPEDEDIVKLPDIEKLLTGESEVEDVDAEDSVLEDFVPEEAAIEEDAPEELTEIEPTASVFDDFTFGEPEIEEFQSEAEEIKSGMIDPFSLDSEQNDGLDAQDMAVLDDLFQEIDEKENNSLLHLLGEESEEDNSKGKKKKKKKKDDRTLLAKLFGNVPIDPSKVKHEPTPEEIAEKKQAKEEKKKKDAEEKKQAKEEKKAAAQAAKEEKAKLAELAKEEKKAKKMEKAKLILEEMKDTRINRVGASIVFLIFALLAFGIIVGSNFITYNIAMDNAEKSFQMARNNDPKYYTDAYNQIYGLESRLDDDDIEFYDKVMTVMFVNKQLNSYNSYVVMGDEASALDSLLKGLKRYEKYSMYSILMGYDDLQYDLDYVRSQILAELDSRYKISMDEAMELIKEQSSTEYAKAVYDIVNRFYGQGN